VIISGLDAQSAAGFPTADIATTWHSRLALPIFGVLTLREPVLRLALERQLLAPSRQLIGPLCGRRPHTRGGHPPASSGKQPRSRNRTILGAGIWQCTGSTASQCFQSMTSLFYTFGVEHRDCETSRVNASHGSVSERLLTHVPLPPFMLGAGGVWPRSTASASRRAAACALAGPKVKPTVVVETRRASSQREPALRNRVPAVVCSRCRMAICRLGGRW
jgi:hypothetical protein